MFDFLNTENNSGDLANKIKNEEKISDKNKLKILKLLDKINNDWLTDDEISLVTKELEYYKELEKLKILYNSNRDKFWDKTTEELDDLISIYEEQGFILKPKNLDYLSEKISSNLSLNERSDLPLIYTWKSYRDFIKKHIDLRWVPETVYETDFIKDFYNIFVISYRKYIENRDNTNKMDLSKNWLDLNKLELIEVINTTIKELQLLNKKDYDNLVCTLTFSLKNWETLIQEIKNINMDDFIPTIKFNTKEPDIKKISTEKTVTEKQQKTTELRDLLLAEGWSNFVLSEYIENEWMPQSIIDIFDVLSERYLWWDSIILDSNNKNKKIDNLKKFLEFVLKIESFWWKNIPNLNWSWAEGFYQLHTKNYESDIYK